MTESHDLTMTANRGKVTFTQATTKKAVTWVLDSSMAQEELLDVMEDVLLELRYVSGFGNGSLHDPWEENLTDTSWEDKEPPAFDGIAFQPPKTTVVGGSIEIGAVEPTAREQ